MQRAGLLVAAVTVVVAVLLCGEAAEAKRISRCEMKKALEEALILPSQWKKFKNLILARGETRSCSPGPTPCYLGNSPEPKQGERFYGVFQLNDRFHCDSNLQPSWNLCQTNCQDIYDDVALFSSYLLHKLKWVIRIVIFLVFLFIL
uniref:Lysozyme n=1 Tax=Gadus morhua TaxID=8049 RepID=A0A8C5FDB8_GADMO